MIDRDELDSTVSERLDWLEDLKTSPGYELVKRRIRDEIERSRDSLERSVGAESTSVLRGYISACRMVLDIPEILKSELKEKEKSQ